MAGGLSSDPSPSPLWRKEPSSGMLQADSDITCIYTIYYLPNITRYQVEVTRSVPYLCVCQCKFTY